MNDWPPKNCARCGSTTPGFIHEHWDPKDPKQKECTEFTGPEATRKACPFWVCETCHVITCDCENPFRYCWRYSYWYKHQVKRAWLIVKDWVRILKIKMKR